MEMYLFPIASKVVKFTMTIETYLEYLEKLFMSYNNMPFMNITLYIGAV